MKTRARLFDSLVAGALLAMAPMASLAGEWSIFFDIDSVTTSPQGLYLRAETPAASPCTGNAFRVYIGQSEQTEDTVKRAMAALLYAQATTRQVRVLYRTPGCYVYSINVAK